MASTLALDDTGRAYVRDLAAKRAARKEAEVAEKRAADRLRAYMGTATVGTHNGEVIVERVAVTQRRFDRKRFKEAHPDLEAEYLAETSYERIDVADGLE